MARKKRRNESVAATFPPAEAYLIVDGYNMVGAIRELSELARQDFDAARDQLIDWLAEFGGRTRQQVIAVFDAHHVPAGLGSKYDSSRVNVMFTKENETADELIERLVASLRGRRGVSVSADHHPERFDSNKSLPKVTVATSDQLQQHLVFGYGALRMPASELEVAIRSAKQDTRKQIRNTPPARQTMDERIPEHIREKLDQMRKGNDKPGAL